MSLNALISHYNAGQSPDDRREALAAIAAHLPAPEFLWYPIAVEALQQPDVGLKLAALELLAHAPQSWDMVLVAALSSGERELQLAALRSLAAHAALVPHLAQAYQTLGSLPGWQPDALALWQALQAGETPPGSPDDPQAIARLEARLEELSLAHATLEASRLSLASALEAAQADQANANEQAEQARAALAKESARYQRESERWAKERENLQHQFDYRTAALQASLDTLQKRHTRTKQLSAAAAAVLIVVGLPALWATTHRPAFVTAAPAPRSAVTAAPAATAIAPVGGQPAHAVAARAARGPVAAPRHGGAPDGHLVGYQQALHALAARAESLADRGYLYPALATWRSYAAIATGAEAAHANQQAQALLDEIRAQEAPKRLQEPGHLAPRSRAPMRHARVPMQPPTALEPPQPPVMPGSPIDANAAIPDRIRDKF